MTKEDIQKVSAILTCNGIEHDTKNEVILINRDSIINKISGKNENDSYTQLREILNDSFNGRFVYAGKTDEWLMLDRIS